MVNIIDTFRNVIGDKYSVIKLLILSFLDVIHTYAYLGGQTVLVNTLNIVLGILFLALFFETIRRSCASEPMLMPSFLMPIRIFITFGLTIVAAIPSIIICGGIVFGYFQVLKIFPDVQQGSFSYWIITGIAILFILSIFFASITQFLDTGKIVDSYNPIKIVKALNRFIINIIGFVIQDIFFIGIIGVIPLAIIYVVFGFKYNNFAFYLYSSFFFVMNWIMFADFIAQTKKESECY